MGLGLGRLAVSAGVGYVCGRSFLNSCKGDVGSWIGIFGCVPVGLAAGSATFIGLSMLMAPAATLAFCATAATSLAAGFGCKFISNTVCDKLGVSQDTKSYCAKLALVVGASCVVALPYLTGVSAIEGLSMAAKVGAQEMAHLATKGAEIAVNLF